MTKNNFKGIKNMSVGLPFDYSKANIITTKF